MRTKETFAGQMARKLGEEELIRVAGGIFITGRTQAPGTCGANGDDDWIDVSDDPVLI
jgi:hypothetical protein